MNELISARIVVEDNATPVIRAMTKSLTTFNNKIQTTSRLFSTAFNNVSVTSANSQLHTLSNTAKGLSDNLKTANSLYKKVGSTKTKFVIDTKESEISLNKLKKAFSSLPNKFDIKENITQKIEKIIQKINALNEKLVITDKYLKRIFSKNLSNKLNEQLGKINSQMDTLINKMKKLNINKKGSSPPNGGDTTSNSIFGKLFNFSVLGSSFYFATQQIKMLGNAIGKVVSYADSISQANAKLKLISKNNNEYQHLKKDILDASNRSRSNSLDFTTQVAKLSLVSGKVFNGNNQDVIKFVETLNKAFIVGGASESERRGASLQLTQALGSGRLQGDEFRSVLENAPLIANKVAQAMGVPFEQLKKLSSEGKISAQVLKDAILESADEINEMFKQIPITGAQMLTILGNNFRYLMHPLAVLFSRIFSNPTVQNALNILVISVGYVIQTIVRGFSIACFVIGTLLSPIQYVIEGLANMVSELINVKAVGAGLAGVFAVLVALTILYVGTRCLGALKTMLPTLITMIIKATKAVWAFNVALLANPLTWVAIVLAVVIGLITYFAVKLQQASDGAYSFKDALVGAFWGAWEVIKNVWKLIWNLLLSYAKNIVRTLVAIFNSPLTLFKEIANKMIGAVEWVINKLLVGARWLGDKFGIDWLSNLSDFKLNFRFDINEEELNEIEKKMAPINKFLDGLRLDYGSPLEIAHQKAKESAAGGGNNFLSNLIDAGLLQDISKTIAEATEGANVALLGNTDALDKNTKSHEDLKEWKEDLKLLYDIANKQSIVKITSPQVTLNVEMQNAGKNEKENTRLIDEIANKVSDVINNIAVKGVN